mmetsp:Transcript_68082/g.160251  ORF Transcript_68082/g.160251 Transcript_68082/m.160251 type:complete len:136 (+) Transcript_68082:396-803(+)
MSPWYSRPSDQLLVRGFCGGVGVRRSGCKCAAVGRLGLGVTGGVLDELSESEESESDLDEDEDEDEDEAEDVGSGDVFRSPASGAGAGACNGACKAACTAPHASAARSAQDEGFLGVAFGVPFAAALARLGRGGV